VLQSQGIIFRDSFEQLLEIVSLRREILVHLLNKKVKVVIEPECFPGEFDYRHTLLAESEIFGLHLELSQQLR
jgi:hypothetical protein